jgi:hypothetical protein
MRYRSWSAGLVGMAAAFALGWVLSGRAARGERDEPAAPVRGWVKGEGWGWKWGKDDEVGALNGLTPAHVKAALGLVREGKVYDLGVPYDRQSFRWPGHSPGEVMTYRGPEGVKRQGDNAFITDPEQNPRRMGWHSCALFINDNVGTQLDGLAHITRGDDNHWYNGFKEADWGGNFGVRKCDATTIPPIVTRGVLIDVAGLRKVDALPPHYRISADDLKSALERQGTKLQPGDTVLVRTGTLRYWARTGPTTPRSARTTAPASTWPRRSGSWSRTGRSSSARTPAASNTRRRPARSPRSSRSTTTCSSSKASTSGSSTSWRTWRATASTSSATSA